MTTNVNLGFVAAATGTVNAITATYSPAPTALVDKMLVWFRATGANTSTTPTFSPNGLTARTIVKQGGQALVAGDIPGVGAIMEMVYDSSNTRWELLNPSSVGGWHDTGVNVVLNTITDNVGIGTATPTQKLHVVGGLYQIFTDGVGNTYEIFNNDASGYIGLIVTDTNGEVNMVKVHPPGVDMQIMSTTANLLIQEAVPSGNVGIGTPTPTSKLHINGTVRLESLPAYADDAAAGAGGLTTGNVYQTTGTGGAPLNVAGILMVKQ